MNINSVLNLGLRIIFVASMYLLDFAWPLLRPIVVLYLVWLGIKISGLLV